MFKAATPTRAHRRTPLAAAGATLLGLSLLLTAAPALGAANHGSGSTTSGNGSNGGGGGSGNVKVHDAATGLQTGGTDNEPQVCDFWLAFDFADTHEAGAWSVVSIAPTGDGSTVASGTYDTAGDGTDASSVIVVPPGHYRVEWAATGATTTKKKTFWVDDACRDPAPPADQPPAEDPVPPSDDPAPPADQSPAEDPAPPSDDPAPPADQSPAEDPAPPSDDPTPPADQSPAEDPAPPSDDPTPPAYESPAEDPAPPSDDPTPAAYEPPAEEPAPPSDDPAPPAYEPPAEEPISLPEDSPAEDPASPSDEPAAPQGEQLPSSVEETVVEDSAPLVDETAVDDLAPPVDEAVLEDPAPPLDETAVDDPAPPLDETAVEDSAEAQDAGSTDAESPPDQDQLDGAAVAGGPTMPDTALPMQPAPVGLLGSLGLLLLILFVDDTLRRQLQAERD